MGKLEEIETDVGQLKFLCEAGQCLTANGRINLACDVFQGVVAIAPRRAIGHTLLGEAYLNLQKYDDALQAHQRALDLEPNNTFVRVHYAYTLLFKKQKDKALTELRKVLEMDPKGSDGAWARQLIKGVEQGVFAKL